MTDYADWNDTHFDALPWDGFEDESDYEFAMQFDDREQDDQTAWMDAYDYDMGAEDAHLDSYWEWEADVQAAFWGGE